MNAEPCLIHHFFFGPMEQRLKGFERQIYAVFLALGEGIVTSLHWQLLGSTGRTEVSAFPSGRAICNEPYEPSGHIWLCPTNAICVWGMWRPRNQCRLCGLGSILDSIVSSLALFPFCSMSYLRGEECLISCQFSPQVLVFGVLRQGGIGWIWTLMQNLSLICHWCY